MQFPILSFFFVARQTRNSTKTDERRAGKRSAGFVKFEDKPVQSQWQRFPLDTGNRLWSFASDEAD